MTARVASGDYIVSEIGPGDMYYIDRTYVATNLPPFLQYLNGIRTANNDAHSDPNDTEFLCFDVEEKVRVYVMYDARAYDQPAWLKNRFVDKHTEVIENSIVASPYYEVYSAPFEAGTVCLGGNDADGVIENYWVLVGPDEWKQFDPRSTVVSSRFFDGSSDYITFDQPIGTFDTVTIDTWIKWHSTQGNHPIMNEDNWNVGDLHYQIYASQFGFDVHGRGGDSGDTGDYTFRWQPTAENWYFISVTYKSSDVPGRTVGRRTVGAGPFISLHVDDQFVEDSTTGSPIHGPAITFDSPRIGAWVNGNGVQRSMDGQLSVFRIWSIETDGRDMCAAAADVGGGLQLSLILSDTGDTVHDISGKGNNGHVHDAEWSDDTPPYDPNLCLLFDLTHSAEMSSRNFDGSSDYIYFSRPLGTYDVVTIDTWIKWHSTQGNHPIMNEDNWNVGDLHYQIYASQFGFDVHGRGGDSGDTGDYTFRWQPSAENWYFISVTYKSSDVPTGPFIKLSVNEQFVEDSTTGSPIHGPAITFDSPRIGAWFNTNGVQRSLDGQLSVFRLWSIETDGRESCGSPATQIPGLELSLSLSDTGGTALVHDLSLHGRDGTIHDASWNAEAPPYRTGLCAAPARLGSASASGAATVPAGSTGGGGSTIVVVVICLVLGAGIM